MDALTLAQLLRIGMIPEAHKVSDELRAVRDTLRTRLHLVEKHTSAINPVHRVLEKFNVDDVVSLPELFRRQADMHTERAGLITRQIKTIDQTLNGRLLDSEDVQRLLWIPGIGRLNAFTIYLEVDGMDRFESVKTSIPTADWYPEPAIPAGRPVTVIHGARQIRLFRAQEQRAV